MAKLSCQWDTIKHLRVVNKVGRNHLQPRFYFFFDKIEVREGMLKLF